jgi:hypothetical protein
MRLDGRRARPPSFRQRSRIWRPAQTGDALDLLPACNAKAPSRMRRCVARASHFYRAKFIPQFFVNRRKIILQIPAMMPGLF